MSGVPTARIRQIEARYAELTGQMSAGDLSADKFVALSKEYAELKPVAEAAGAVRAMRDEVETLSAMVNGGESDREMVALAEEELLALKERLPDAEKALAVLLLPKDMADERSAILEIRAGTGGEEAALFAADLYRMYQRYAETQGWRVETMEMSSADAGGIKEVIANVTGQGVFAKLKFESGVHRVQRVPATEAQGRVHTSTATVAVLPEAEDVDVQLDEKDLQISIAASGGPGGQGVNTTNSAVQVLHKPTGLIVKCQDGRSQLKNKAQALTVLRSRLLEMEQRKRDEAITSERRGMVGTGERAEKVRTYNFPQNRVTDHRAQLTLYKLDRFVGGDIDEVLTPLRAAHQAERLRRELGVEAGVTATASSSG